MKVQVLLSTYNGVAYLEALLESLLKQDYPDVEILARDDGSSDGTAELLGKYAANNPNISVTWGPNLGPTQSFFSLLKSSSSTAQYFGFCDQDDVWQRNKVSRAVARLSSFPREVPALYSSRLAVVDQDLRPLGYTRKPKRGPSFRNALVQCVGGGCGSLFNQAARQLLLREVPQWAYSHDWWTYLVISAFGLTIYDERPTVLYRRHGSNASAGPAGVVKWRTKLHRFLKTGREQRVLRQAEEFERIYGPLLPDEPRRILKRFLETRQKSFLSRLGYALSCDVYRHSPLDHLILKGLIAVNRL